MSLISSIMAGDVVTSLLMIISRAFVVFLCLPVHELAHGWAAYKLGDDTAKVSGRLTFNPLAHLNPIGTIMIFIFGIGYAQPVPINPLKFKDYRKGVALTAFAGPLSNIVMGCIFVFLSSFCQFLYSRTGGLLAVQLIALFLYQAAQINISLAVFNLIPVPPLDGSRILAMILPDKIYNNMFRYERYIMLALMFVLLTGVLNGVISALAGFFMRVISFIPNLIFGL